MERLISRHWVVHLHHGCGGVAVSTIGCGPVSPGSSPGHGPKNQSQGMFCNHFRTQNDPLKLSDPFFRPS